MSNHEAHTRITSTGTYLWLSPIPGGYLIMGSSEGIADELGTAVIHRSGKWGVKIHPVDALFTAETLHGIAELTEQLNLELKQEQEAK